MILTWIPNKTLQKNPRSIENSPNRTEPPPRISPRRSPRQEFAREEPTPSPVTSPQESNISSEPNGTASSEKPPTTDESSSGSDGSSSYEGISEKVSSSFKSQSDSGIGHEEISDSYKSGYLPGIHKPVMGVTAKTELHSKKRTASIERCGSQDREQKSSGSSMSDSPTTDEQLNMLVQNKVHERVKERTMSNRSGTSSNRSVSIEMEGDNLVVTTEELEDSPFEEPKEEAEKEEPVVNGEEEACGAFESNAGNNSVNLTNQHWLEGMLLRFLWQYFFTELFPSLASEVVIDVFFVF